jgi:hypothetical protein
MTESVMPCFAEGQAEAEGKVIGKILAGYGELELEMCSCLAAVNSDIDLSIKLLFQVRGEERRIQTADKIMRVSFASAGLGATYCDVIADMGWCRSLRNQYAHSNWYYTQPEGLCIIDLEVLAKQKGPLGFVTTGKKPLSLSLLLEQDAFFAYVKRCFWFLAEKYREKDNPNYHPLFPLPPQRPRPLMHG